MNLDVGGGNSRGDDWTTVDLRSNADFRHDLNTFPYPFEDNSIQQMRFWHTLEHLHPWKAMQIFRELYRIMKLGGTIDVRIPWWKSDMFSNPNHLTVFKPEWFKKGLNPNPWRYGDHPEDCGMNWRVVWEKKHRGKHNFFKIYEYQIIMVKERF